MLETLLQRAEELSVEDPTQSLNDWRALQRDVEIALAGLPRTRNAGTEEIIRKLITVLEQVIEELHPLSNSQL
jgi:hypothetical protein